MSPRLSSVSGRPFHELDQGIALSRQGIELRQISELKIKMGEVLAIKRKADDLLKSSPAFSHARFSSATSAEGRTSSPIAAASSVPMRSDARRSGSLSRCA